MNEWVGVQSDNPDFAQGLMNFKETRATGLIITASLDMHNLGGGVVDVTAITGCSDIMDEIGVKDITLQRWDGSQWINLAVWSHIEQNSASSLYYYITEVGLGYFYRFTAIHYAKKGWWIFAQIQEFCNETSYILVD